MANTRSAAAIVLLVDDESPVREVQRRALELDGYVVEEAGSGLEGIGRSSPRPGSTSWWPTSRCLDSAAPRWCAKSG